MELHGAVDGWVTGLAEDGVTVVLQQIEGTGDGEQTFEKKGSARVRWVNYNFATTSTWDDDQLAQVIFMILIWI